MQNQDSVRRIPRSLTPPPLPDGCPEDRCNLVMKGGVTSGLVYPGAVRVLATHYRFRRIGGTSAGAIAAVLTAAAEYRRREHGTPQGFEDLWQISAELAARPERGPARTRLEALFAPNHRTRALHRLMTAAVHADPRIPRAVRLPLALLQSYPLPTAAAAVGAAGTALGALRLWRREGRGEAAGLALGGTWLALAGLGRLAAGVVGGGRRALTDNHLGLSTGYERRAGREEPPRFTGWLHDQVQAVAGRTPQDPPLTFGDLAPGAFHEERPVGGQDGERRRQRYGELAAADLEAYAGVTGQDIDLRLITTDLAAGRPLALPLDGDGTDAKAYYFRPDEWQEFFPDAVLGHLQMHSERQVTLADPPGTTFEFYRLPPPPHLPVVVATRLSMSFPGLFSAVPLYTPGWLRDGANDPQARPARARRAGTGPQQGKARFRRVLFGDGGLTSNFPLTLFDDLVPAEPTFGLNLEYPDQPQPSSPGSSPRRPVRLIRPEALRTYGEPDPDASLNWKPILRETRSLTAYLGSMVEAARNWSDNAMIGLPGVAERVAHITIDPGQGGTNLTMTGRQIDDLRRRGLCAGHLLLERFAGPEGDWNWDVHRAAHFVTLSADLERLLQEYRRAYGPGGTLDLPGLARVPLQTEGTFFPAQGTWDRTRVDEFLRLGGLSTTLRGYRRLRGKRGALRYRPLT